MQAEDGTADDGQKSSKRGLDTEQNANKAPDRLDQRNVDGGDLKD